MTKLPKRLGAANSLVDGRQFQSEVAALPSGSHVVVWTGDYTGGDVYGINARLFSAERADCS